MTDQAWMEVAKTYLGLREIKGPVHEAKIVELFRLCGHGWVRDDETAWCAAFVGGVFAKCGIPGTGKLTARSYERWGQKLSTPIYGCVGVKARAGGASWQGHVGFVVGASADKIILIGGNQSDMVSIAAFPREDFTAFRYPPNVSIPTRPRPLPMTVAGAAERVRED